MLVPIRMGTNMATGNQQKHLSLSLAKKVDFEQPLSFPSVFLAFLSGKLREARAPLPIPSSFLSLICIVSTEFRARRTSGTKTDYS